MAYAAVRVDGYVHRRAALRQFAAASSTTLPEAFRASPGGDAGVDTSLWAEGRIKGYEESLRMDLGRIVAILRIPKIGLEVPVFEGTDEITLNRGLGRIPGTARPGDGGNLGLAGHRDGFFRGLKDIEIGDVLELESLSGYQSYRVSEIKIVLPADVEVLDPTAEPTLTLVTCYPFYFVGKAPKRFIVRASAVDTLKRHASSKAKS